MDGERINHVIDMIKGCEAPEIDADFLAKIADIYEARHAAYHAVNLPPLTNNEPFGIVTYPTQWVRRYIERDYAKIDPVIGAALKSVTPVDWDDLKYSNDMIEKFWLEAEEFGINRQGITIPIRGPAGQQAFFTLNTNMQPEFWDIYKRKYMHDLQLIGHYIHQKISDQYKCNIEDQELTVRQKQILTLFAQGKTADDISQILNLSPKTVQAHAYSARYKLNALNTANAVALAIMLGFIENPPQN